MALPVCPWRPHEGARCVLVDGLRAYRTSEPWESPGLRCVGCGSAAAVIRDERARREGA